MSRFANQRASGGENNKPFSTEEFRSRLRRVQALIQSKDLVGLMVYSPANIYYLSGYHTSAYFSYQVLFVPARGEPLLLVRELERTNADEYAWVGREQQAIYTDIEDPVEVTVRWLAELGWLSGPQAVGVEKADIALTVRQYERLREGAGRIDLEDGSGLVDQVRLIKSPQEIAYIRRAAEITDIGLAAGLEALTVGTTENEVAAAIHEAQVRLGCEYTSLPHYISSGRRRFLGHATPSEKVVEKDDIVRFEITACVKRYSAAIMRTAVMGTPSDEVSRASDLLLECQEKAFSLMRPGAVAGDVDAAVRQPVLNVGLRETYTSRVGYSLGVGFPPVSGEWAARDFMAGDNWILQPNMVFHMIVVAKGISFSETILVTETGHERLGSLERRLTVIH
ncbi:Xaa-Pro peptidase family protein [Mesorhizobium sp.]|uniref:M24 family metallopeptidase n=1 Tax=Mesorhizobium sp. TaxID=1871066 RepID=UPI0025C64F92|nr:Xaa-Pro peptidase family protein [Mesorhizobium sp.]